MMLSEKTCNEIDAAVVVIDPYCEYCESVVGHTEVVHTDDQDSLHGWEVWFCCHSCRDKSEPCETFFKLEKQLN